MYMEDSVYTTCTFIVLKCAQENLQKQYIIIWCFKWTLLRDLGILVFPYLFKYLSRLLSKTNLSWVWPQVYNFKGHSMPWSIAGNLISLAVSLRWDAYTVFWHGDESLSRARSNQNSKSLSLPWNRRRLDKNYYICIYSTVHTTQYVTHMVYSALIYTNIYSPWA